MTALYLQILALFTVAFFLGAALGCLLRRTLAPARETAAAHVAPARRVEPLPGMTAAPKPVTATAKRLEQAISGATSAATPDPAQARPAAVATPPAPSVAPATPIAATVAAAAVAAAAQATARAAAPARAPESVAPPQPVAPSQPVAPPPPRPAATVAASPPPAVAPAPTPAAMVHDDLKRIRGIDAAIEAALNKRGIARYGEIAKWTRKEVSEVDAALGLKGRIERENWIEQAQILANNGETAYSRRRALGQPNIVTTPAAPSAPTSAPPSSRPDVESRAAFAERREVPAASAPPAAAQPTASVTPIRPAAAPERDALQRISGINAEIEKLLNMQGVTRYGQIASWTPAEIERFDRLFGATGRIGRENWIEQAQILARGGDTGASRGFDRAPTATAAASPASAPEPTPLRPARLDEAIRGNQAAARTTDVGALKSVRSEAFQQRPLDAATAAAAAAAAAAGSAKVVRAANMDDLKRIRGVGVLIEKRLNAAGVTSYDQIAQWTADDVAHFSRMLDFKGRIERENWVEQARILSSGGFTEFSKRVDRGEVETSRPKT
jgi:predicted flap endonuclease-1-like 5' DNA nuclease